MPDMSKVEKLTARLMERIPVLMESEIELTIKTISQSLGGRCDVPEFRRGLIKELIFLSSLRLSMGPSLPPPDVVIIESANWGAQRQPVRVPLHQLGSVLDDVLSGEKVDPALESHLRAPLIVRIARMICHNRGALTGFAPVTTKELAQALQQLELEAAYAAHNEGQPDPQQIDGAVQLMTAADLACSLYESPDLFAD